MSVILKAQIRDRLAAMRKAFEKQSKELEAAVNKQVSFATVSWRSCTDNDQAVDRLNTFFRENETADGFFDILEAGGNAKVRIYSHSEVVHQPVR